MKFTDQKHMRNQPGVYLITNTMTGKTYVGASIKPGPRCAHHAVMMKSGKHTNKRVQKDYDEHGLCSFVFAMLESCAKEEMAVREQHYHDLLNPTYHLSGNSYSPTLGVPVDDEQKAAISATLKRKYAEGMPNPSTGTTHSPEMRQKLSEMATGRKLTDETKAKIAATKQRTGGNESSSLKRQVYFRLTKDDEVITRRSNEIMEFLGSKRVTLHAAAKNGRMHKGYKIEKLTSLTTNT